MKRIFIILSLILIHLSCLAENQNRLIRNLHWERRSFDIPYISCRDTLPLSDYAFPIDLMIGSNFDNYVWEDLALIKQYSKKVNLGEDELWLDSSINKKFNIAKDFILFSAYFGEGDFGKHILVTILPDGTYIDSIAVGASILSAVDVGEIYQPMKWEITEDLRVITYQLKPTSATPIMGDTPIADTIEAQRIDRIYQLGDNGKFTHLVTKYYKPQMYSKNNFLDPTYDISAGGEQIN